VGYGTKLSETTLFYHFYRMFHVSCFESLQTGMCQPENSTPNFPFDEFPKDERILSHLPIGLKMRNINKFLDYDFLT